MVGYEWNDTTWQTADIAKPLVINQMHARELAKAKRTPCLELSKEEQNVDAQRSTIKMFQRTRSAGQPCNEVEQDPKYSAVGTARQPAGLYFADHHSDTGRYSVGRWAGKKTKTKALCQTKNKDEPGWRRI